jgi:hypothetical protein
MRYLPPGHLCCSCCSCTLCSWLHRSQPHTLQRNSRAAQAPRGQYNQREPLLQHHNVLSVHVTAGVQDAAMHVPIRGASYTLFQGLIFAVAPPNTQTAAHHCIPLQSRSHPFEWCNQSDTRYSSLLRLQQCRQSQSCQHHRASAVHSQHPGPIHCALRKQWDCLNLFQRWCNLNRIPGRAVGSSLH